MEEFHPLNEQAFAVLSQRFGLDIAFGHRDAVRHVETSVASHLRVCIKTTEDRIWSYSTYPSEPILSCVAASLLHGDGLGKDDTLVVTLRCLERMVNDGLVDIGRIGELVSRFLWLLAKDFFVRANGVGTMDAADGVDTMNAADEVGTMNATDGVDTMNGANPTFEATFDQVLQDCQLVPVVQFLEFVFGRKIWEAAPEAEVEFQNAYINFSHWVSMDFNIRRKKKDLAQLS